MGLLMQASRIVAEALEIPPAGDPCPDETNCVLCGIKINKGDLATIFSPGPSFTDAHHLGYREKPTHICGYCSPFLSAVNLRNSQKLFASKVGAFPLYKTENKKWFLLNPPEPPFVAVISDAKIQHILWKTPITRSKELILLQLGNRLLSIRMAKVKQAFALCQTICSRINIKKGTKFKPPIHPFVRMDMEMWEPQCYALRADIKVNLDEMEIFSALTLGDWWALTILIINKEPVKPKPITINKESESVTI